MADCPADSPLSTAGNVTGILTFVLGVVTFSLALCTILCNEGLERHYFEKYAHDRQRYITRLHDQLSSRWVASDNEAKPLIADFDDCLNVAEVLLSDMKSQLRGKSSITWYWRRKALASLRDEIDLKIHFLTTLQIMVLSKKSDRLVAQLTQVEILVAKD